jgi:transcription initiation factor IIE alpha subunit
MNKVIYASLIFLFTACAAKNEKTEKVEDTEAKVSAAKTYACPMQCEGDKTYTEAGKCPVCKMELQEVALAETDSTHQH